MGLINYINKLLTFIAPQDSTYNNLAPFTLPSAGALAAPTSGTATWGTYVELISSANNTVDRIVEGIWLESATAAEVSSLELAQGASGSELPRATVVVQAATALDGLYVIFTRPIKIKAGQRIAVRASSTTNATAVSCKTTGKTGLNVASS